MFNVKTDYLALGRSTSRGRDTYGYNICRLDVRSTNTRFRCMGGGYDMEGTVVGEWIETAYQNRLLTLNLDAQKLYGAKRINFTGAQEKVYIDGACGIESVLRIAEAIGICMSRTYDRKGRTTGYLVADYGSAEVMRTAGR